MQRLEKESKDTKRKLDIQPAGKDPTSITATHPLSEYLGISSNEWLAKDRREYLDMELNRNLQRRLMHQTFVSIEREVMANRMMKIIETKTTASEAVNMLTGGLQINCV
jgi:hypothetical protein